MTTRRERLLALTLALLGGATVLLGTARAWVTVTDEQGRLTIKDLHSSVTGHTVAPGIRALGVVALAAVLAVVVTRGRGRVVVGVMLAATGVAVMVQAADRLDRLDLLVEAGRDVQRCFVFCSRPAGARVATAEAHLGPVWLTLLAGALVVAAGLLTVVRGRGWAGMGSSYDAPGGPPPEPTTDKAVWDALDRGDDPTT